MATARVSSGSKSFDEHDEDLRLEGERENAALEAGKACSKFILNKLKLWRVEALDSDGYAPFSWHRWDMDFQQSRNRKFWPCMPLHLEPFKYGLDGLGDSRDWKARLENELKIGLVPTMAFPAEFWESVRSNVEFLRSARWWTEGSLPDDGEIAEDHIRRDVFCRAVYDLDVAALSMPEFNKHFLEWIPTEHPRLTRAVRVRDVLLAECASSDEILFYDGDARKNSQPVAETDTEFWSAWHGFVIRMIEAERARARVVLSLARRWWKEPRPQSAQASNVHPLTERERAVLDLIKSIPSGRGITGKEITTRIPNLNQATLTKWIVPVLKKHFGVKNRPRFGYYIDGKGYH